MRATQKRVGNYKGYAIDVLPGKHHIKVSGNMTSNEGKAYYISKPFTFEMDFDPGSVYTVNTLFIDDKPFALSLDRVKEPNELTEKINDVRNRFEP